MREASAEDVVINLVGSGTATYGEISDDGDWLLNNGSGNCSAVTGTSCQITITAGETVPSDNAVITIHEDGGGEDPETIILSTTIASGDASLTSRPLVLTIPVDPPLPTVSLNTTDPSSIREGGMATITLTLSEGLGSDATFNLIGSGDATYGTDADWNLSVGGTDCDMASESNPCQVTISQGDTTAEVTLEIREDATDEMTSESFTVSVAVDSGSVALVQPGSRSSLNFTIPENLPNLSFNYTGNLAIQEGGPVPRLSIDLSEALTEEITFNLALTGEARYGGALFSDDWQWRYNIISAGLQPPASFVNNTSVPCGGGSAGVTACDITIPPGATIVDVEITVWGDGSTESPEDAIATITIPSASRNLVKLGSTPSLTFTISDP